MAVSCVRAFSGTKKENSTIRQVKKANEKFKVQVPIVMGLEKPKLYVTISLLTREAYLIITVTIQAVSIFTTIKPYTTIQATCETIHTLARIILRR
jgi:hypothetical protein